MKKVIGILLIGIGSFLSLASLMASIPNIIKVFSESKSEAESLGYAFGTILAFLIIMGLAILLIIKGAKLAKSSKQKISEPIEEY